ncbi:hypothetical protein SLS60_005742 [Paraconiothyrium brasiliense]|uniref:Uncharacterized protein n=1 Tax=Paraconiothyrium brasiliense TaxID=300254 RepID=A0ABR3RD87_9PLEO
MSSPPPRPAYFSPERLEKAEQQAAESYRLRALQGTNSIPRRTDSQRLIPPLPLQERKLHPAYKARLEYRERHCRMNDADAVQPKPRASVTLLTEGALSAHNKTTDGAGDQTKQQGIPASTTASLTTAVSSCNAVYQGDQHWFTDGVIGENHGKYQDCEDGEYFTSLARTHGFVAPVAHVNIRTAPHMRHSASWYYSLDPPRALSTVEQIGQDSYKSAACIINSPYHANTLSTQHSPPALYLSRSTPEGPTSMSTPAESSEQNIGVFLTDGNTVAFDTNPGSKSVSRPPPVWKMTSQVEETSGLLRAASDGKILEEQTGDIVHLDIPDDEAQQYYAEVNSHAIARKYAIPELKNGATANEDPRARKPIARVIKNWWTGSSRPPRDKPQWIFQVGDVKPTMHILNEMIQTRRHQGGANVRYTMIKIMKRFWNLYLVQEFGHDWASKADDREDNMREMEDFVMELGDVSDRKKVQNDDEEDAGGSERPAALAPSKKGWLW